MRAVIIRARAQPDKRLTLYDVAVFTAELEAAGAPEETPVKASTDILGGLMYLEAEVPQS